MKALVVLARLLVGGLFIFSGFVKTVDPIGFGYKLQEYFAPDVFNLPFLESIALPLSVFFVILEVMLGLFLILGIYRKITIWSILLLIVFFTFLTFYSAYFNKVTDCGCFGDALKLTPWESFYKDIILLILILFLFWKRKLIKSWLPSKLSGALTIFSFMAMAFVAWHGINRLPLIDFRPFAVGNSIAEGMKSAEELGLKPPEYEVFYEMINQKNNEKLTISATEYVDNTEYQNTDLWQINPDVDPETRKIADGYEPPVKPDFQILCAENDETASYLEKEKVVLVVVYSDKELAELNDRLQYIAKKSKLHEYEFVIIANRELKDIAFPVCSMDSKMLKTIIRSSPGLVVLENGTITEKIHFNQWESLTPW